MPSDGFIVASTLRGPFAAIRGRGGDPEALARRAGIGPGGAATLPLRGFVGLFQAAAAEFGAPGLGWDAGARFAIDDLGPMGAAVGAAPRLGAALGVFCRAFAAVQSDSLLELRVAEGRAALRYRILDPDIWPREQDAEFTMAILARLVGRAAGPGWRPLGILYEHAPRAGEAAREAAPGCPVVHGGPCNELRFPAALLDRPMPGREAGAFARLARELAAAAAELRRGAPLVDRVRAEILARLGDADAGQAAVAAALGRSERSLRRQLAAEGAGFADLLGDCRCALARRLLAHDGLGVDEIAARLRYSDATAFERAFRRRTGQTPAQARRALSRGGSAPA